MYSADSTERPTPARASDPGLRALGPSARETLRNLLRRIAPGFQVAPTAIDLIVEHAQVTNWRAGQKIVAPGDPSDFVYFLVGGAVRLDLQIGGRWLTAGFVPAGNFIGSALPSVRREFPFAAVAHVPSLIALVSHDTMRRTFERLRPEVVYRIVANEVARLQSLVVGKTRLLASPLQDRLTSELAILARDFGRPGSDGILIDLPLIHRDLAQLVVASRANVTRALCALRHAGTIDLVSRRILLRCPANDR